ncbi:MAG TPA: bestrophin family ion channel [Taishania sp.]|nr:bestrophin family ion channel [Taishania sp.]
MITYNPKSWLKLVFSFRKSDTTRILLIPIISMAVFTTLIAYIEINYLKDVAYLKNLMTIYTLIGFVISMLLVFRTNTAYDRWWEGRRKWGELINESRNIAIKLSHLIKDKDEHNFYNRMLPNFAFALKTHLQNGVNNWSELDLTAEELQELKSKEHVPAHIVKMIYQKIYELKAIQQISEIDFLVLDKQLKTLMEICGACERIKKTPIPYSYSMFLKKFILIYVVTIPIALVPLLGYVASAIATFIFYILMSIEIIAEEIEDPFGGDDNDLPTDVIAMNIKKSVHELLN